MIATVLALAVTGLVMLLAGVRWQARRATHRDLAHQHALGEALAAAGSALEEARFRMQHLGAAQGTVSPGGRGAGSVKPEITEELVRSHGGAGRIVVEPVRWRTMGRPRRTGGRVLRGTFEMSCRVRAQSAGFGGPRVTRCVMRRHAYHTFVPKAAPGAPPERPRVIIEGDPLCEWVAP